MGFFDFLRSPPTPPPLYDHGGYLSPVPIDNRKRGISTGNTGVFGPASIGPQNGGRVQSMHGSLGGVSETGNGHQLGVPGSPPANGSRGTNPGMFGQAVPATSGPGRGPAMQGFMGLGGGGGGGGRRLDGVGNSHPAWNINHINGGGGVGGKVRGGPTGGAGGMGGLEAMGEIGFGRGGMRGSGRMGSRRRYPP